MEIQGGVMLTPGGGTFSVQCTLGQRNNRDNSHKTCFSCGREMCWAVSLARCLSSQSLQRGTFNLQPFNKAHLNPEPALLCVNRDD